MEQMKIEIGSVIPIDYETGKLPQSVKIFKPIVFKDECAYCVILGPDRQEEIFGCGETKEAAIIDWDNHFKDIMDGPRENTETMKYILEN
jgi:hypothetical protein